MNDLKTTNLNLSKPSVIFCFLLINLFLSSCSFTFKVGEDSNEVNQRSKNQEVLNSANLANQSTPKAQKKGLSKAEAINRYIGFLDQNQVDKIKNYDILGSNFHSEQSIYNVAFFLPSNQYRNENHAKEQAIKELHRIYADLLNQYNLVLLDKKEQDGSKGLEFYKIQGVDCLETLNFNCQLNFFTLDSKITPSPEFIYRKGGSYFIKIRVRMALPKGIVNSKDFYPLITRQLPNWTFNLVDYETNQVVHIQRGYQKYFF